MSRAEAARLAGMLAAEQFEQGFYHLCHENDNLIITALREYAGGTESAGQGSRGAQKLTTNGSSPLPADQPRAEAAQLQDGKEVRDALAQQSRPTQGAASRELPAGPSISTESGSLSPSDAGGTRAIPVPLVKDSAQQPASAAPLSLVEILELIGGTEITSMHQVEVLLDAAQAKATAAERERCLIAHDISAEQALIAALRDRLAVSIEYVEGTPVGYGEDEIDRLHAKLAALEAELATVRADEALDTGIGERLRKLFDKTTGALEGSSVDYPDRFNAGLIEVYACGRRKGVAIERRISERAK